MTSETDTMPIQMIEPEEPGAAFLPAHQSQAYSLTNTIMALASHPNVDIDKVERLLIMRERIATQEKQEAFNCAMRDAQAQMRPISADAENPQTRSRYATYSKLDLAVRPIYTDCGFSLSFDTGEGAPEAHVRILCYVSHSGGHTRTYKIDMPSDGKGAKGNDVMTKAHASGSAISYGMRYLLKMIFNIAVGEDDDDGNAASAGAISEFVQGWVDYALSHRQNPDKFKNAVKEARKAISDARDAAGMRAFNARVS